MGLNGPKRETELVGYTTSRTCGRMQGDVSSVGRAVEDLVQEGLIALMIAARRWRPDGGACLRTYSDRPIRSSMRRLIARRHLAHVGIHKAMHLVGADVPRTTSMDSPARSEDDALNLHELLGVPPTQEDRSRYGARSAIGFSEERSKPSTSGSARCVIHRFRDEMTFEDIGEHLAITHSTAFRIFTDAISKLRSRLSHLTEEERHVE